MENHIVSLIKNKRLVYKKRRLQSLKKNKVRVKLKTIGVCASDVPRAFENGAYNYPLVMGHEMSGEIYESKIKNFKYKDKVSIFPLIPCKKCENCKVKKYNHCKAYGYYGSRQDGGFAKFIDVDPWNIIKTNKRLNFLDTFALEPSAVALNTVNKTFKKKPNKKKILIIGSGFIGLLISKIIEIKFQSSDVTIIDRNKHKLKLVSKKFKKKFFTTKKKENFFLDRFDYVIDTTGSSEVINLALNYVKNQGSITLMGNINENVTLKKKNVNLILRKELSIIGVWNSNYKSLSQNDWNEVLKLLKKGLKPSKYLSHKIKLEQLPKYLNKIYLNKLRKEKFKYLKIVVNND